MYKPTQKKHIQHFLTNKSTPKMIPNIQKGEKIQLTTSHVKTHIIPQNSISQNFTCKQKQHSKEFEILQPLRGCQNKFTQTQYFLQNSGKKDQKRVVLIGLIGSGKTTLFNKITKGNQKTQAGGASVTQSIFSKQSADGMGFTILDTPGLGVFSDKLLHACSIKFALSEGQINRIMLVVKAERTDQMRSHLYNMLQHQFQRFRPYITVVVTCWDHIETESKKEIVENTKNSIQEMLKTKFNIDSVLFVSKTTSCKDICKEIDKILIQSEPTKAELTDTEFYSHFDLFESSDKIEHELSQAKEKVTVQFRKLSAQIKTYILNFDEKSQIMPDVMHALTLDIKSFAEQVISNFENDNKKQFSKLLDQIDDPTLSFLIDVELKKELKEEVNKLIIEAQKKMRFNQNHCFNQIKRCPYCDLIWLKVAGCDGQTQCGQFPSQDSNECLIQQAPRKFKFYFSFENLELIQLETQNSLQAKTYKGSSKLIGCGKKFIWYELPQLSEAEMRELVDPGILDFLAQQVSQKQEKLKRSLEQKVKTVTQQIQIVDLNVTKQ